MHTQAAIWVRKTGKTQICRLGSHLTRYIIFKPRLGVVFIALFFCPFTILISGLSKVVSVCATFS